MKAATLIASLDRQLAAHGSPATLRRPGSPPVDAAVRVVVRNARIHTEEDAVLDGRVVLQAKDVTLSASDLGDWAGALAVDDGTDAAVPRPGDVLIIAGRVHQIANPDPRYIDGTLVRVNLTVIG